MNISHWIDKWAKECPDSVAIRFENTIYSYSDFSNEVNAYAHRLQQHFNISLGDRIAYLGHNSPNFLFLMFACARIGAAILPINWRLTHHEQEYILDNADIKLLCVDTDLEQSATGFNNSNKFSTTSLSTSNIEDWCHFHNIPISDNKLINQRDFSDEAVLLIYTSGTTGYPKGVLLSNKAILANAQNSQVMHKLDANDHILVSLPFFHVGGLNILTTPAFYVGGSVTVHRVFNPQLMLESMINDQPTRVPIVSAQMPPILGLPEWRGANLSHIKSVTTGASPVPPEIYKHWKKKSVPILQVYGSTETCPIAIHTSLEQKIPNISTTGQAAASCNIRIVDDNWQQLETGQAGEILVKGDSLFSGYWQNKIETAQTLKNGWYATGDIAYQDDHGFYYIVDRKKDVIISGGENIYSAELEKILMGNKKIVEAAVIAKPDKQWGEIPIAVIRLTNANAMTHTNVLALFENKLAKYKHPKEIIFVDDFPRNSIGKIQKFQLKKQLF